MTNDKDAIRPQRVGAGINGPEMCLSIHKKGIGFERSQELIRHSPQFGINRNKRVRQLLNGGAWEIGIRPAGLAVIRMSVGARGGCAPVPAV